MLIHKLNNFILIRPSLDKIIPIFIFIFSIITFLLIQIELNNNQRENQEKFLIHQNQDILQQIQDNLTNHINAFKRPGTRLNYLKEEITDNFNLVFKAFHQ